MKLRNLRLESKPKLMIIPMIDIIFFLLVFFMMSTLYMVEANTIPLNLPQASSAKQDLNTQIPIAIAKDGLIYVEKEEIPLDLLSKRLQAEQALKPNVYFVLRADSSIDYGTVISVLDKIKQAGIEKVSIATDIKGR